MRVRYNRFAVCEPLEIVDAEGKTLLELKVAIDLRAKVAEVQKVQETFKNLGDDPQEIITATYDLIRLVYGAEGAEGIRALYGNNATAISEDIMPHIIEKVAPAIKKASRKEAEKRSFLRRFR